MLDLAHSIAVDRQKRMGLDPIGNVRSQGLSVIGRSYAAVAKLEDAPALDAGGIDDVRSLVGATPSGGTKLNDPASKAVEGPKTRVTGDVLDGQLGASGVFRHSLEVLDPISE